MSSLLSLSFDGPVATLTLDDGRGNALGSAMLSAIDEALATAAESAGALIVRGREKVFCGGLDLPEVVAFDRPRLEQFMSVFESVHDRLLSFPVPVVTAARGSAVAGGAILLCAGDARLVTPQGKAGITEAALGLNIPTSAFEVVRVALGDRWAADAALTGRLVEGDERLRVGFATEVVPADAIDDRARELATAYARNHRDALGALRRTLRDAHLDRVARLAARDRAIFLDRWFAPDTQARLKAVVAKLTAR